MAGNPTVIDKSLTPLEGELMPNRVSPFRVITVAESARAINQNPTVTKSNNLIRSFAELGKNEQKLLAAAISKLNPKAALVDRTRIRVEMTTNEIAELLHIPIQNVHKFIVDAATKYHSKPIQTPGTEGTGKLSLINIAHKSEYDRENSKFSIEFHDELIPELLDLSANFTSYRLSYQVALSSKYVLRLYEIFKSVRSEGHFTFLLWDKRRLSDSLYFMLGLKSHDPKTDTWKSKSSVRDFSMFRQRILEPSIKEINAVTDIEVRVHDILRRGRSVHAIRFHIKSKTSNQVLIKRLEKLDLTRENGLFLVAKYDEECVIRNAALMEENLASGATIRNRQAYLTRLCRYDMAALPETVNPVSDLNRSDRPARLFLEKLLVPIWSSLSDRAKAILAEYGLTSMLVAEELKLFTAILRDEGVRVAASMCSKAQLIESINAMADRLD